MAKLTANQESFIKLMTESEELARRGFGLLLERKDFADFFDALSSAGLFNPDRNPGREPAEKEGYFRIPFWSALDYLKAIAKRAGEIGNMPLADKVMTVVRSVSLWRDTSGNTRQNYHTSRTFAEIFALLPSLVITFDDLDLIPLWLNDQFDRGLVAHALDEGVLNLFLASPLEEDWKKALVVIRHCTAIRWISSNRNAEETKPANVVDDFWLKELLQHHAKSVGAKTGKKAAEVFEARVREVFGSKNYQFPSRLYRPAIEEHAQNHELEAAENRSIEGLRDVLLGWSTQNPQEAGHYIEKLVTDEIEIVRRIGIYVIGQKWSEYKNIYKTHLSPALFDPGHIHELHGVLKDHFSDLSIEDQNLTLEAIRTITISPSVLDPVRSLKRMQQRWLSAIVGKGFPAADLWFSELNAGLGGIMPHPDFDSYMESRWGPGSASYSTQQLIEFASANNLVEKLNSFEEKDPWNGPTMDGLVAVLDEAVRTAPDIFVHGLPAFLRAKAGFQYSIIWGLKLAWEKSDPKNEDLVNWDNAWARIVEFFELLMADPEFWEETSSVVGDWRANRDWVLSAISEFIDSGCKNDNRLFPEALLPRTWPLIKILLDHSKSLEVISGDSLTQAINSSKGKAIEALFSQALRICRAGDRERKSHAAEWDSLQPLFETELLKCKDANFEFSAIVGAYLAQLDYMSNRWTKDNINQIFSQEFVRNCVAAVGGLAYASFTLPVYTTLVEGGVLDYALRYNSEDEGTRNKLVERIAGAYLWGKEELNSSRFEYLFDSGTESDLEVIARLFGRMRDQELTEMQQERIVEYWKRCLTWAKDKASIPEKLFSALSISSWFLKTADGINLELLKAVAPYVTTGYNADYFFKQLLRLSEISPEGVSIVLGKSIEGRIPDYDYDDDLKSILLSLARNGKKQEARLYADKLRALGGMQEIFNQLTD